MFRALHTFSSLICVISGSTLAHLEYYFCPEVAQRAKNILTPTRHPAFFVYPVLTELLPNQKVIRFQTKIHQTKRAWCWPIREDIHLWDCGRRGDGIYACTGVNTATGGSEAVLSLPITRDELPTSLKYNILTCWIFSTLWVPRSPGKTRKLTPSGSFAAQGLSLADQIYPGDTWIQAWAIEGGIDLLTGASGVCRAPLLAASMGPHWCHSSVFIWEASVLWLVTTLSEFWNLAL